MEKFKVLFSLLADLDASLSYNRLRTFSGNEDEMIAHTTRVVNLEGWLTEDNGDRESTEIQILVDGQNVGAIPAIGFQVINFTGNGTVEDQVVLDDETVKLMTAIEHEACDLFVTSSSRGIGINYDALQEVIAVEQDRVKRNSKKGDDDFKFKIFDLDVQVGEMDSFGPVTLIMKSCFGTFLIC